MCRLVPDQHCVSIIWALQIEVDLIPSGQGTFIAFSCPTLTPQVEVKKAEPRFSTTGAQGYGAGGQSPTGRNGGGGGGGGGYPPQGGYQQRKLSLESHIICRLYM